MSISRGGKMFLVLMLVLHILWTARSLGQTTTSSGDPICTMTQIQLHLGMAMETVDKAIDVWKVSKFDHCPPKPEDCSVLFACGKQSSGIYTLWPRSRVLGHSIQAYCDMETDGGGWTVIQRRGNYGREEDYFYQGWNAYKEGFGNPSEDFWLGNDIIFAISNQNKYSIRFDLKDIDDNARWAKYDHFWIDSEEYNYTLHVTGYKGDAGDSFSYHSGRQFTTKDRDNDIKVTSNCAMDCKGAWWYGKCFFSNLNGLYLKGYVPDKTYQGIHWHRWRGSNYSFPSTEIKIKPLLDAQANSGQHSVIFN